LIDVFHNEGSTTFKARIMNLTVCQGILWALSEQRLLLKQHILSGVLVVQLQMQVINFLS